MKTINNFVQKIFNWIWYSSSNPAQVSVTVKSTLTFVAGVFMQIIGLTHLNLGVVDAAFLNTFVNDVTTVVLDVLMAVGAIGTVIGSITKVWTSLSGKNPVLTKGFVPPTV